MRFGSLFSGVGGFDKGFEQAGMGCAWQVEIDEKPSSVLKRHWPEVTRYADVRTVGDELEPVELICGGFPCQDLSVAGRRAGLSGERSGLWFEFHRVLACLKPRWVVIENVPGLLSSNGGRDFAVVLRGLVELGYGVSYRILDAQFFGVAQRRRRVFIVGSLGDGRSAQVLFESEGVSWNPPTRSQTREGVADIAIRRAHTSSNGWGVKSDGTTGTLDGTGGDAVIAPPISPALTSRDYKSTRQDVAEPAFIVSTMTINGDAHSEFKEADGLVAWPAEVSPPLDTSWADRMPGSTNQEWLAQKGGRFNTAITQSNRGISDDVTETVRADSHGALPMVATFDPRNVTSAANRTRVEYGAPSNTLHETGMSVIGHGVRRLTPRECERLQGFPDDWTRWDAEGNEISDSARYRMLGNAVAVPCAKWIGERLNEHARPLS